LLRPAGFGGPGFYQPAMQRNDIEHLDFDARFDHKPLNNIDEIHLAQSIGYIAQIPSRHGRLSMRPALSVQSASSIENPVNSPLRRYASLSVLQQCIANSSCSILPERTRFEFLPKLQDTSL